MRVFKTILIVVGIYLAALITEVAVALNSSDYEGGVTILVILGAYAFLSPKVGYRWFDCFFAAIPFYGIYFIFKIAHRVAGLPSRDWETNATDTNQRES
jgi:hypothetical protein